MNRGKSIFKSWFLVWGVTFLIGGLIIYIGYQRSLALSSQERRAQNTTSENSQVVSAQVLPVPVAQDAGAGGVALIQQTQIGERSVSNALQSSSRQADSAKKALSLKDFPSPVQGNILRNVGNYYSEVFKDYLFHAGTDYAEPEGTMIRATHGGKVVSIGLDPILGQKVTLDCGEGWTVTYGGLDNLRVQNGETVETQGLLGQVGFFPGAEGGYGQSQLHYEIWYGDKVQSSGSGN
jgi:murein DD-endopeptidase MepM/ murein hydrolase activator NlpD